MFEEAVGNGDVFLLDDPVGFEQRCFVLLQELLSFILGQSQCQGTGGMQAPEHMAVQRGVRMRGYAYGFYAQPLQFRDGCALVCYIPCESGKIRDNDAGDVLVMLPAIGQHLLKLWTFIGCTSRLLVNKHFQLPAENY
jgi:hypothetical protein